MYRSHKFIQKTISHLSTKSCKRLMLEFPALGFIICKGVGSDENPAQTRKIAYSKEMAQHPREEDSHQPVVTAFPSLKLTGILR